MKTAVAQLVSIVGVLLGATLFAQGFSARTGTWEFNMTMGGAMPMDGVPAERRAQMEAELRKPRVFKSCVTADDLKSLTLGKSEDNDDEDCKVLTSRITPTTADVTRQCTGDEPYTETAHFEAPTPQSLTAHIARKRTAGTMTVTMTGKWVAAACKE